MHLYNRLKRTQRKLYKTRKEQWTPLAQRLHGSLIRDKHRKLKNEGENACS